MHPGGGTPSRGARESATDTPVTAGDYHRLLATLAARARRLGSRDPEGASQEALKRSLENATSRSAMDFYFSEATPGARPEWPLDHLLAWLHAVLQNVIREERSRVGYWREVDSTESNGHSRLRDASPDPLQSLIRKELAESIRGCFDQLDRGQRAALQMRANGLKYGEIAARLGVNENTVATWISRGTRTLGRLLRSRMGRWPGRSTRWGR